MAGRTYHELAAEPRPAHQALDHGIQIANIVVQPVNFLLDGLSPIGGCDRLIALKPSQALYLFVLALACFLKCWHLTRPPLEGIILPEVDDPHKIVHATSERKGTRTQKWPKTTTEPIS